MYYYVEDKNFLEKARSCCSRLLKELEENLREKGINSQFFLVGSGGRNMITQNENGSIDFDYNLNIISCPSWNDSKGIKELVRKTFNQVMKRNNLNDVDDSTSSLTSKPMYLRDDPNTPFSIDLCIVTKDTDNEWQRLIHEKTGNINNDKYFWNTAPNSKKYSDKVKKIKSVGRWNLVRDEYLNIKNHYLGRNDYNHPSFICFIEAVNNVYNHLRQKRII